MPFQSIEPRRLYRQIADQIRTLIGSGEFPAGSRLPSERDLAKQLGVSRPSVREALIALVLRRSVEIEPQGQDVYGREIGRLWLGEQDVGAELVRSGMAWAWRFQSGRGPYARLQREARLARRGLFGAQQEPMAPALFRRFHGPCEGAAAD